MDDKTKGTGSVGTVRAAQRQLDAYQAGIVLLGGNLEHVVPPIPVREAFIEVASAKKDSERLVDEARGYESRIIPRAGGEAQQIVSQAQGHYAQRIAQSRGDANRFLSLLAEYRRSPAVTQTRLYLEAMERVLAQVKLVILDRRDSGRPSRVTIVDP
jgi:membrane protease subunit HflK